MFLTLNPISFNLFTLYGVVLPIFEKVGINTNLLNEKINNDLEKFPKVSGSSSQVQISSVLNKSLESAEKQAVQMKDEYVAVDHILLGIVLADKDFSNFLKQQGIKYEDVLAKMLKKVSLVFMISLTKNKSNFDCSFF